MFLGVLSSLTLAGLLASNFRMYWIKSICSGFERFLKLSRRERSSLIVSSSKSSRLSPPPPPETKDDKNYRQKIEKKFVCLKNKTLEIDLPVFGYDIGPA